MARFDRMDSDYSASQPPRRPTLLSLLTWGILACLLIGLIAPLAGLRIQSTDSYLGRRSTERARVSASDASTGEPSNSQPLSGMTVAIWFLPEPTYVAADQLSADQVLQGTNDDGALTYYISYTEGGFNAYIYYWYTQLVQPQLPELTNPYVDVRPGAMMIYADVTMGESDPARVGLLYELDETGTQVKFRGIEVKEQLILTEEGSFLDEQGMLVENLANRALTELVFLDPSGRDLAIHHLTLGDDSVEVLAVEK
jgi:hypothetical protein